MMRRAISIVVASLALLAVVACAARSPKPPGARDAGTRVVALSPAIASIMRDVGLGDLIVGRHASDEWSDPALPVCGDQIAGIDYETLLRVQPTHVFLQLGHTPPRLAELAQDRGFVVRNYSILSLDEIRSTARELSNWSGTAGAPGDGPQPPTAIDARMDAAWSARPGIDPAKVGRVLLLAQIDPAGALGPGSWHDDLLRRLGATPALTVGAAFITMDAEEILRLAPDAIILFIPRPAAAPAPGRAALPTPDELRTLLGRLATPTIPAVARGRIALIDHPMCQLPSTAMIRVADELAAILEEWSKAP